MLFFLIEHSTAMCKVYEEFQAKLEDTLRKSSLRRNSIEQLYKKLQFSKKSSKKS